MYGISRVGNSYYSQIASGKRIQRASDGPAESAILQKREAQIRGYEAGTRNAEIGRSVLDIADGAASSIADQLQQMRELAVQASNTAVLSKSDRYAIQDQIKQLKAGISDIANYTEFNTQKLLNGSNSDMQVVTGANGQKTSVDTGNATLEALGIADFDVTGDFDISTIDKAISMVSQTRSSIGAQSNVLDYTIGYNTQTSYNLTKAQNELGGTDIAKAVTENQKQQLLETMRFIMQKRQAEEEQRRASILI